MRERFDVIEQLLIKSAGLLLLGILLVKIILAELGCAAI